MKLLMENWRRFVTEGGNVFAGQTASIPREFIEPTLEKYREELKRLFPQKKRVFNSFRPLGSVGKKPVSGDIDLGIDATKFFEGGVVSPEALEEWEIDPMAWQATFDKYKKRARTRTDAEIGWRAFLTEIAKYINEYSDMINSDLKKIGPGTMFSLFPQFNEEGEQQDIGVQIDWMVGDVSWLEFAYWSDMPSQEQEFLKGLHRTQLMLSMFLIKDHTFNHVSGVKNKATGEIVATPKETLALLGQMFGGRITRGDTLNFNTLHDWLKVHASLEDYNQTIGAYLKILDRTKSTKVGEQHCGYIPRELEEVWINRQQELKLSGKYICKDTNPAIWEHIYGGR